MAYDAAQLLDMSAEQLDELFKASPAGDIPDGAAKGTAIIAPGTKISETIAELINHFGWQGKVFDAKKGVLKNRILVIGLEAILARVYKAPSWLDSVRSSIWMSVPSSMPFGCGLISFGSSGSSATARGNSIVSLSGVV